MLQIYIQMLIKIFVSPLLYNCNLSFVNFEFRISITQQIKIAEVARLTKEKFIIKL